MSDAAAREALVTLGRSLFLRGLTHGSTGNLSVRVDDGILLTPTGSCLGELDPAHLSLLDARDPALAFGADGPQLVKAGVEPSLDQPAFPERKGRIVVNGPVDELIQVGKCVPLRREFEYQL